MAGPIDRGGTPARYAKPGARVTWGTETAAGLTCFSGLAIKAEARRLRDEWDDAFPDHGPYSITRNGAPYFGSR